MRASASVLALLLALQAVPSLTPPAHAQVADAQQLHSEDRLDAQKLQFDYRATYARGTDMPAYSADEVTETGRKLADGNQINRKDIGLRARDRNGRVHVTYKTFSGAKRTFIADPKAGTAWLIRPERKDVLRLVGAPSAPLYARSFASPVRAPAWSREVRTPLGVKDFDEVRAVGYLTETLYPPGARGNEKEMVETREYWSALEIGEIVYTRSASPANGDHVVRLENLKLDDVPESLFAIPVDYAVRDIVFDTTPAPEPAQ